MDRLIIVTGELTSVELKLENTADIVNTCCTNSVLLDAIKLTRVVVPTSCNCFCQTGFSPPYIGPGFSAIAVGGCAICSPGTYGVDGDTVCTDCPVDTFASSSGQTACTACPQGEYFNGTGASACTACDLPTSDGNLTNGGFEDDGTLGTYVRQVPSGWSGVGSVFIIPSGDAVWSSITAPSGATFVGIEYTAGTASSINQTLNLTNGVQYELSFYARYRTQAGVTFLVSVQGAVVFGPTTLTGTFTQYRSTFTVPHGVCGMDFSSLVDIKISTVGDTGDRSTLLDDVQLTAIQNFCDCPCPAGYTGIGISGPSTGRCTACDAGKYKSINGYVSRDLGQAILALHVTCICPALCVRTGPLAVNNITYCLPVCASSTEHPAPLSVILGMSVSRNSSFCILAGQPTAKAVR